MWKSCRFDILQFNNAEVGYINCKKRKLLKPLLDGTATLEGLEAQAGEDPRGSTLKVMTTMIRAMDDIVCMNAPEDAANILLNDMEFPGPDAKPYLAALLNESGDDSDGAMDFTPTKVDMRFPQSERWTAITPEEFPNLSEDATVMRLADALEKALSLV